MTYKLVFKAAAKKEWDKLDTGSRRQFKKKLVERLDMPRVESARLSGMQDCYKIKLRSAGYRMVYIKFATMIWWYRWSLWVNASAMRCTKPP